GPLLATGDDDDGKRAHAERSQLCRQVEALAESHDWLHARTVIERAEAGWAALGDGDDALLADRMKGAIQKFNERYERYGAQVLAEAEAREVREARSREPSVLDVERPPEPVHVVAAPVEAAAESVTEPVAEPDSEAPKEPTLSPEERRAANLLDFQAF